MASNKTFFGHPRGLATLFFTEMWERFSYYGMRALLFLFIVAPIHEGGLGFDDKSGGAIYGLYTMFVYLLALPGGWIADNLFGLRRSIFYGGCIIAAGHFCLALPYQETFFIGLLFIVMGTGLLKPNISSMVGELYGPEDQVRRDNGFSIFYMGINIGALIAPIICGYLGENVNWHYGFAAAGIGMVLGVIQFKLTEKNLGDAGITVKSAGDQATQKMRLLWLSIMLVALAIFVVMMWLKIIVVDPVLLANSFKWLIGICVGLYFTYTLIFEKLDADEKKKVAAIAIVFVITAIFYTGYEGQGSTLNIFAKRYTDLVVAGFATPASWFQSLPPIYVVTFVPIFTGLWIFLASKNSNPSTPVKLSLGLVFTALAYVAMIGASFVVISGQKALPTWLFLTYLLLTFGEICLYPIGLSGITKLSPKRLVGRMMGVFFMALALGNLVAGLFAGDIDEKVVAKDPHVLVDLFQFIVIMMMASAVVVLLIAKPLRKLMGDVR
ncbi:peptide MFS transporter [Pseudochryseolinea flava]|uniref:MFS transporter n=1 Tax=Pseudochryseolinea flava TaxID=2059302 RepID=A0A364Y3G7_9BACT|nr:peptide MFS transporter [Pseudochryseolinea flava]RAW01262.1 MFS transporter [Pseudochryseolinea flava]